jgi:hypothetical protein
MNNNHHSVSTIFTSSDRSQPAIIKIEIRLFCGSGGRNLKARQQMKSKLSINPTRKKKEKNCIAGQMILIF